MCAGKIQKRVNMGIVGTGSLHDTFVFILEAE